MSTYYQWITAGNAAIVRFDIKKKKLKKDSTVPGISRTFFRLQSIYHSYNIRVEITGIEGAFQDIIGRYCP